MSINFRFEALQKTKFQSLFALDNDELLQHHAKRLTVDSHPGYPCRVSLMDARLDEQVIALSFTHHDVDSPYRASGPIFVRENAETCTPEVNEIPGMFRIRPLSVRAYDTHNLMIDAKVVESDELKLTIESMFQNKAVDYIHLHNGNPGCYNCAIYRA